MMRNVAVCETGFILPSTSVPAGVCACEVRVCDLVMCSDV